jgi:hypothetical protein
MERRFNNEEIFNISTNRKNWRTIKKIGYFD